MKITQANSFRLLLIVFIIVNTFISQAQHEQGQPSLYEKAQDSLRQVLLTRKENSMLKNSVFQELYLRNQVELKNKTAHFDLFLDLHEWDCGAPDNYGHSLTFQLSLNEITHLPKQLIIKVTKDEKQHTIKLNLIRSDKEYVIYHAEKRHNTLIIFKNNKKVETALYYFQNLQLKDILHKNAYQLIEEGQENEEAPWRSTVLSYDYESFL